MRASTKLNSNKRPLAFFVPNRLPEYPGVDRLVLLQRELMDRGLMTYYDPHHQGIAQADRSLQLLEQALRSPGVDRDLVALIGVEEGADLIAKSYYDFYRIQFPRAAVLFNPSVTALHLNNLTCPYLLIQGDSVPEEHLRAAKEAVAHHLGRYGDLTQHLRVNGSALGPDSIRVVSEWLPRAMLEGLRPQERMTGSAA